MNPTKMRKTTGPAVAALSLALALGACGAANEGGTDDSKGGLSGTLNAGGASSQEAAVAAWQKGFQSANPEVTVNYDPVGSGGGREQFLSGGLDLAGSDAYLEDAEVDKAKQRCGGGDIVSVPTYISPIAVIFNVEGVDELNLTPKTIGGIFEGKIKTWNDPAIKADNPDAKLPSSKITPVHRSDDSGTTENFTEYMDATSGGAWSGGVVETWPVKGGEAAEGTSGVVSAVKNGQGTIGYADASQAGDLGSAAVKVGDDFVKYSPEAAAAVLDASKPVAGRAETDLALDIDRKSTEKGVYPIVLASYQIACQQYDDKAKAELVKKWLEYVVSDEGQQTAADDAGSAPLSDSVSQKAQAAVETIQAP